MKPNDDYDDPGGQAWDGWPEFLGLASFLLTVAIGGIVIGGWACFTGHGLFGDPVGSWHGPACVLSGVTLLSAFVGLVRIEFRVRRKIEEQLIEDKRGN